MTFFNMFPLVLNNPIILSLLSPKAYIDPNTGGMLFQVLALFFAFFSGILFFFSRQIKSSFARLRRNLRSKEDDPGAESINDTTPREEE